MEDPKNEKIDQTISAEGEPNQEVNVFEKVDYGLPKESKIIEIKIVRRLHLANDYLGNEPVPHDKYHYYIFYANGESSEKPGKLNELGDYGNKFPARYQADNCTNTGVWPGQRIKWICLYPFTIYYGGTSIITTDEHGWPRPYQIIPYLKASTKDKDGKVYLLDDGKTSYYATQDAWIVNNVLKGDYKYNVSVYIPKNKKGGGDIICVDDPLNSFPPPT